MCSAERARRRGGNQRGANQRRNNRDREWIYGTTETLGPSGTEIFRFPARASRTLLLSCWRTK